MTELSIRVEPIAITSTPTTGSGQIDTPNQQGSAAGGSDPLDSPQRAARIGDPVPIIFGRRVDGAGGVLISPPATEARFENDATNAVTASYLVVLTEGVMDGIQVRDVFQQSCRVGTFTSTYDRRAGSWGPGNFIEAQPGFEDQVPNCPIYCGSGTGSYAGMTTGSFVNTIPAGFTQWDRQVHAFARGGMHVDRLLEGTEGPSNNVADLVRWMLRRSSRVPEDLIDSDGLLAAAEFTEANGFWCNMRIDSPSNLADWLEKYLGYFLLRESRRGGRRGLRPLLPTNGDGTINDGPVPWVFTFSEDYVLPGSVEISYTSRTDRLPFCVQALWRQQPEDGLGLARTAEVRYAGSAPDGPFEQHDLSAFCTTEQHAVRVAAYILARRRYIDHRMTIRVRPGAFNSTLSPGDVVRVVLRRIPSVGNATLHDRLYEVDRLARAANGQITLELTHLPVDDQGRSLVALDVMRAQVGGVLLPTGRANVTCDLNDPLDTSVLPDDGPWDGWSPDDLDPDLYVGELPDGVADIGDGWGPGGIEPEMPEFDSILVPDLDAGADSGWTYDPGTGEFDLIGTPPADWTWDAEAQEWEWNGSDPDWAWDQADQSWEFVGTVPDGWAWNQADQIWEPTSSDTDLETRPDPPPYNPERPDFDSAFENFENPGNSNGYTASVSLSAPLVGYPDVWYSILEPGFVSVRVAVSVNNPPVGTALQIALTDGTTAKWDPENGQFGEQNTYTVTIPVGQTHVLATLGSSGDSPFTDTSRTISIASWSGGGYVPARDGGGSITTPALNVSATQTYNVEAYVGTPTILQPGIWLYDSGTSEWSWEGPAATDFTWDPALDQWEWTGSAAGWSWVQADQRWSFTGTPATGWEWLLTAQRWRRTSSATALTPRPDGPPAGPPSPLPISTPPADHYSVVMQVEMDNPPVHATTQNLQLDIQDILIDEENPSNSEIASVGTLVIPAIGRMFGSWEWNPATELWDYPGPPAGWRWHPSEKKWLYRGPNWAKWEWRQAESDWTYTGEAITDWEWNLGTQTWDYTGGGAPGPTPAGPPITSPPSNPGGAAHEPPDGERWTWNGTAWSGATNAYMVGGSAPVFDGLKIGRLTYHMPLTPA